MLDLTTLLLFLLSLLLLLLCHHDMGHQKRMGKRMKARNIMAIFYAVSIFKSIRFPCPIRVPIHVQWILAMGFESEWKSE